MQVESVAYEVEGEKFQGEFIHDETAKTRQPLLLMCPNWAGITDKAINVGKDLAANGYVVFVADMHGLERRPTGKENPMEFLQPLIKAPATTRRRVNGAFDTMTRLANERDVGNAKLRAAIGYCFGGSNVLDLARSGADVAAVVSMHGNLGTSMPAQSAAVKARVLVVHGADDPISPKSDRDALEAEMRAAGAHWTLLAFGGVHHGFTDTAANRPPSAQFSAHASRYGYMLAHAYIADSFTGRV